MSPMPAYCTDTSSKMDMRFAPERIFSDLYIVIKQIRSYMKLIMNHYFGLNV